MSGRPKFILELSHVSDMLCQLELGVFLGRRVNLEEALDLRDLLGHGRDGGQGLSAKFSTRCAIYASQSVLLRFKVRSTPMASALTVSRAA